MFRLLEVSFARPSSCVCLSLSWPINISMTVYKFWDLPPSSSFSLTALSLSVVALLKPLLQGLSTMFLDSGSTLVRVPNTKLNATVSGSLSTSMGISYLANGSQFIQNLHRSPPNKLFHMRTPIASRESKYREPLESVSPLPRLSRVLRSAMSKLHTVTSKFQPFFNVKAKGSFPSVRLTFNSVIDSVDFYKLI